MIASSRASSSLTLAIFSVCSGVMLFQSVAAPLSVVAYYTSVALFVAAIVFAMLECAELLAVFGIFLFSIVVRLMYFLHTRFSILPTGDAYGQYTVLRFFSESSKVSLLHTSNFQNFLTEIPFEYSQWPGLQSFAVAFLRVAGLPTFLAASFVIPFCLFCIWFLLSYSVVRYVLSRTALPGRYSTVVACACMVVAAAQPRFEIPPVFKYDFLAAIFLLAGALLVLRSLSSHRDAWESSIPILIFTGAIVVTHGLTAVFWLLLCLLFGIFVLIGPRLLPFVREIDRLLKLDSRRLLARSRKLSLSPTRVIFLASVFTISWWVFFAKFAVTTIRTDGPFILKSFSISSISTSRVGTSTGRLLASFSPSWLLKALTFRDYFLLGLILVGALLLLIRPRTLGGLRTTALLLSVVAITIPFEVFRTINYNDRPFLTFSPLLALVAVAPIVAILNFRPPFARVAAGFVVALFLLTIALGFWGSSYAPVYMYSNSVSASSFGDHPSTWQVVASFVEVGTTPSPPKCVLTNEIYVTSLSLPVLDLVRTFPYTDVRPVSGCLAVIYDGLTTFNSSFNQEPYHVYKPSPGLENFSNSGFSNMLAKSDLVLSAKNVTLYYIQHP